jgi:hypothetical protein
MNIVEYNTERHYETMCSLWEKCGWEQCPKEALPNCGLVAESTSGEFMAYVGMYILPGKIAFIDWALAGDIHGIACGKALCKIVDKLIAKARENQCFFIYSVTKVEAWKKILMHRGLKVAEKGADTFIMALNDQDTAFISD